MLKLPLGVLSGASVVALSMAVVPAHAGPGDPSATFIAGNAAPGETTSTRCKANGFLEVIFSSGGVVMSRVESGTACTPTRSLGGGQSQSGSDTGSSSSSEQRAEQESEESNFRLSQDRGGAQPPSASEWESYQRQSREEERFEEQEEEGARQEPRTRTIATEIPPQLPPISDEEIEAVDALIARVEAKLEAEAAFKAAQDAVRQAEELYAKVASGALQDLQNDVLNFTVGQVTGLLADKTSGALLGDDPAEGLTTAMTEALVAGLGDQVAGLAEAETPDEIAGLLASKAGEGLADEIMNVANKALEIAAKRNPALAPVAGTAAVLFDISKTAAKAGVSVAQLGMLEQNINEAKAALAQNHAGAVGDALRIMYGKEGQTVLEKSFERLVANDEFAQNNTSRTDADIGRYEEANALYAKAAGAIQQLADIAKEHATNAGQQALYQGMRENLRQTIRRGGDGGDGAGKFFSTVYESNATGDAGFEERVEIAFDRAVSQTFSPPTNRQFEGMRVENYTYTEVRVDEQVRDLTDVVDPSDVAFIGNVRVYASVGADSTRDRRGAANSNTTGFNISLGGDARLTGDMVAGASVQVSHSQEDDDASFIELDTTRVSVTPYVTYEYNPSLYFDAYASYSFGWLEGEARDGTGESGDANSRQWGTGIGVNWRQSLTPDTTSDVRLGASIGRSWSDALVFASRTARPSSGKTNSSLSAKGKLSHTVDNWTFEPSAQLTFQSGSLSSTATRWRLRPQLGAKYALPGVDGLSLSAQAYHDLFEPDLRSFGGSVQANFAF